jgi:histidinol phosphatase-like PHP family hydrolase
MRIKIAVITDVHYSKDTPVASRQGHIGDILLLRTVHRLNKMIRPDVTLVLGDTINDPASPQAPDLLKELKAILGLLESPLIMIPGNHDLPEGRFYETIDRPPEFLDISGFRFVCFLDPEEPGWNARRLPRDLARMKAARQGYDGPIVAIQHVPVFPPGTSECCYGYTNIDEVMAATRENGFTLSIGGHYHPGAGLVRQGENAFIAAGALCESPFSFLVIEVDGDDIRASTHVHQMPPELELWDYHTHTQFAYCSTSMQISVSPGLAKSFGLAGLAFTEHSGQLYFYPDTYWGWKFGQDGIATQVGRQERIADYWAEASKAAGPNVLVGLEVDADFNGRGVLTDADRRRAQFLAGAIHNLPEFKKPKKDLAQAAGEYMAMLERLAPSGIRILAHPVRLFRARGLAAPDWLFGRIVELLKENNVAAEVNFHNNQPPADLYRKCLEAGVKLSFGSDAHALYEVGEFAPHLKFLKEIGYDGDLTDILVRPGELTCPRGA